MHQVYLVLLLDALVLETLGQDECVAEVRQAFLAYLALSYKTRSSWTRSSTRCTWRCFWRCSSGRTSAPRMYTRYTWCCCWTDALVLDEHQTQVHLALLYTIASYVVAADVLAAVHLAAASEQDAYPHVPHGRLHAS